MSTTTAARAGFRFRNSYARLPERMFARLPPVPVEAPRLLRVNERLADELGLDPAWLASPRGVAALAGNAVPEGAEPLAQAYAGHQFGGFSPSLGDGRAILLGEVLDRNGRRRDIQLKGSGQTPFSRRGDGRAAVGPVLREYIIGEAMHGLGIPTTRALAAVATGESVHRETALPGAVLTRVASSHIRVGTFQYFVARQDKEALEALLAHSIARHDPDAAHAEEPALAFLQGVVARQADLVARWLAVGFVHGVMNTDNMAVSGESIDFGPCAFLDAYHPGQVFSSIDHGGRYAYGNQPQIGLWNLTRLAECLVPLMAGEEPAAIERVKAALGEYGPRFRREYLRLFARKLGLRGEPDEALLQGLLDAMTEGEADFTVTFRRLTDAPDTARALFTDAAAFDAWLRQWRARLEAQGGADLAAMRAANPVVIARNHRVEQAIEAAVQRDDLRPFEELVEALQRPFEDDARFRHLQEPPAEHELVRATFCGT
jgi:uncharacterized protein YdiU (UPF0061 family)